MCASCQLGISTTQPNKFCNSCKIGLHNNENCKVQYENTVLCKNCFRNGLRDRSLLEIHAEENWMNKNVPPKKRPRKSYLEPESEFLKTNLSTKKVVTIGLLRNGHLVHLKPIKLHGQLLSLSNTCGFDSVSQIFCCAFCDSHIFKKYVEELADINKFAFFLCKIICSGVNTHTYKLRAEILLDSWPTTQLPENIIKINAEDTVVNVIKKLCGLEFSIGYTLIKCSGCSETTSSRISFLSVEINNPFNIATAVSETCREQYITKPCNKCKLNKQISETVLDGNLLIIEPVNTLNVSLEIVSQVDSIEKRININNFEYLLRGVIGYEGSVCSLGHFIAYCLRHNGKWQTYNDLEKQIQYCPPSKIIRSQLFLYTK